MSSVAYLLKLGENLFYYFEEINIFLKMQILIILYADISDECFYTYMIAFLKGSISRRT